MQAANKTSAATPTAREGPALRAFEPVSGVLILAALERAECHERREREGVPWSVLVDHLGFTRNPATSGKLRRLVQPLIGAGKASVVRRHGGKRLGLTSTGRRQLTKARRAGEQLVLPESPQHRYWREQHAGAGLEIERLRGELRVVIDRAGALLGDRQASAHAWASTGRQLGEGCALLAAGMYRLCEWQEPQDACSDAPAWQLWRDLAAGRTIG